MVIEGSEKFGLAQLHQFRGRVGRSDIQSYCFLFTEEAGIVYNRRLNALVKCHNGFELAEKDLQIRGPGDFVGQRQWGIPDLTMSSLTDTALIALARNDAKVILQEDPKLKKYPLIRQRLVQFRARLHLE
jgi:ATP-dependent DNA helicase RecG